MQMPEMTKTACNQRLHDGAQSRRNSPLFQGCYKIREVVTDFSSIPAELDRIIGVRTQKVSPDELRHCTAQDAHVWIRKIPLYVAHSLGRNVLPGLLASVYEGTCPKTVCKAYTDLQQRCEALTHNMDSVLHEAGGNAPQACHLLKPLIQEAIYITQQALAVADPQKQWQKITTGGS
jgi:hypothetical protein